MYLVVLCCVSLFVVFDVIVFGCVIVMCLCLFGCVSCVLLLHCSSVLFCLGFGVGVNVGAGMIVVSVLVLGVGGLWGCVFVSVGM